GTFGDHLPIPHFWECKRDSYHHGEVKKENSLVLSPTDLVLAINCSWTAIFREKGGPAPSPIGWGPLFGLEVYIRPSNHRARRTPVDDQPGNYVSRHPLPVGVFPSSCLFRA
ncbi:hypothetical protein T310_6229, partial [Rasamsonia emersonii CBS 393.64]